VNPLLSQQEEQIEKTIAHIRNGTLMIVPSVSKVPSAGKEVLQTHLTWYNLDLLERKVNGGTSLSVVKDLDNAQIARGVSPHGY
jgi:hypothetical protein